MFEQASIGTSGALRSPWALTFSFIGQGLAIAAAVILSVVHTDALPHVRLYTSLTPPPPAIRIPASSETQTAEASQSSTSLRVFTEPSRIPSSIALEPQSVSLSPPESGAEVGIIGGTGPLTGSNPVWLDVLTHAVAPPPRTEQSTPPKPAVVRPPAPIRVSTPIQAAKLVRQVKPGYPAPAIAARISGLVRLTAIIGRDGEIKNLQLVSGHPFLAQAAMDAVRQWRYQPTLLNGEPVEVITQIDVNFTLSR